MAEATGGNVGLRDEALLESAIETIYSTFDGVELYPTKEEKTANEEVYKLGMAVAEGTATNEDILKWINEHK